MIIPQGQIVVRFNVSPVEDKDSNIDETLCKQLYGFMHTHTHTHTHDALLLIVIITVELLNVLEESLLFKPETLAQLKNEAQGIVAQ